MKTPEEIKKGLRCHAVQWHIGECPDHESGCKGCPYDNDYHDPDELMADALELIRELEKKVPQWISVKDRPPEDVKDGEGYCINYQVYIPEYRSVDIANYIEEADMWVCLGVPVNVTHWMPMPEPPEE